MRWVPPESYHLTLRFLGSVEADGAEALATSAAAAVAPLAPFSARLGALGAFPTSRRPRVVVLGVTPEGPLRFLAARLEEVAVAAGLSPEARPFRAHLTLGRVRRDASLPRASLEAQLAPVAFEVSEVVLFRSRPGSVYTPLARGPLVGLARPVSDSPCETPGKGDAHGQERTHP